MEELQVRLATSEAAAREGEARAAALQGERGALKEAVDRLRRAQAQKEEKLEALRRENAELARSAEQQVPPPCTCTSTSDGHIQLQ